MATAIQCFNSAVASTLGAKQVVSDSQKTQACKNIGALSTTSTEVYTPTQVSQCLKNFGFQVGSAAFANNIYGGRDLLTLFTEAEINAKVAAGDFSGMFAGDYITKTITVDGTSYTRKWLCAGFDHYFHTGDTPCTTHHIVMTPDDIIGTATMNSTNTTSGGFLGSAMWKTTLPKYTKAIQDAFGASHVMKRRAYLSNSTSSSVTNRSWSAMAGGTTWWGCTWTDVYAFLPTEVEYFGSAIASSSVWDVTMGLQRLPLFMHCPPRIISVGTTWMAGVASNGFFTILEAGGMQNAAGSCGEFKILPLFCWC